jgi:hypothetical protein
MHTYSLGSTISICDTYYSPCAHNCYDPGPELGSIRCSCFKGYRLKNDARNCLDIDECKEGTHNCDKQFEECINNPGGFQCIPRNEQQIRDQESVCLPGYKWNITYQICRG